MPAQPEAHAVELRVLHVGVVEVEVGLAGEEIVQVILHAPAVPGPGAAAENAQPVVGRRAVGLGVGPHEPVGAIVGAVEPALLEPGMLVRAVADDLVDDDLEPERVRLFHQPVEIAQRAEDRIDVAVVRHVVAEILHRRGEERAQPDGVDAEIGDVVEPLGDADEVADAVAIVVLEGARVDLVDHRAAPPVAIEHGFGRSLLLRHQCLCDHSSRPPARQFAKTF